MKGERIRSNNNCSHYFFILKNFNLKKITKNWLDPYNPIQKEKNSKGAGFAPINRKVYFKTQKQYKLLSFHVQDKLSL